jgi:circadian clock protein KaiB
MTEEGSVWHLRLFVAGQTPKSIAAKKNLMKLCERHLPGRHHIETVDLMQSPQLAQENGVLAIPTLVRVQPEPIRKVVGDLSNEQRAVASLGLEDAD